MIDFNNLSIGQRMTIGFGALLVLLGALLGGIYSWQQDSERAQRNFTQYSRPLTDADRAEIHKTLKAILHTAQHPTITFRSRRVDGSAVSFACDGELTIMGATHPVALQGRVSDSRVIGGTTVVQSRWGIRPYSAFFGALKLSDEVKVDFDVVLTPHS